MKAELSRLSFLAFALTLGCGDSPDDMKLTDQMIGSSTAAATTGDPSIAALDCTMDFNFFRGAPPSVRFFQSEIYDTSPVSFSLQLNIGGFETCSGSVQTTYELLRNGQVIRTQQMPFSCTYTDLCAVTCGGQVFGATPETVAGSYDLRLTLTNTFGPPETVMSCRSTTPIQGPVYRTVDTGYSTLPRAFADASGDGKADFCRFVGASSSPFLSCGLAETSGLGYQYSFSSAAGIDLGYSDSPRVFADINGDRRADFCRFRGDPSSRYVTCDLADTNSYSAGVWNSSAGVDLGYNDSPRVFVDVNGDGRADFCRFRGAVSSRYITCDLAGPSGFIGTLNSAPGVDLGYSDSPRVFVDVNNDQRADFCRFRGAVSSRYIACDVATATGFASGAITSPVVDLGYSDAPRMFGDVDGDGRADFCRFRGASNNRSIQCNVTGPDGVPFGTVINSPAGISPGLSDKPSALVDVNGDGRADFCRFRTVNSRPYLQCNLASATLFQPDSVASWKSAYMN